jgi:adenine-specific DNA-methyltransferase
LFAHSDIEAPPTEGIKYAGSKRRLLPHILELARKAKPRIVLDGFSGTTRVSQALALSGCRVIANDVAVWSEVFGKCYLLNTLSPEHYLPIVDHLNALPGRDGWFTEHYGGDPNGGASAGRDGLKKPWQKHNTRRLDAIREEIDRLAISDVERAVLLTSLMLALDEVESTLGHFASYLNGWSRRSYFMMQLKVPQLFPIAEEHSVRRGDIFELLPEVEADLAYFDPPYGSNNEKMPPSRVRYAAYYHLWTTVCLNDRPEIFGKAARRRDSSDLVTASPFEEYRKDAGGRFVAVAAIHRLLKETRAKQILLSYSSGGRATAAELNDCMADVGRMKETIAVDYKRNVMSGMHWTREWIREAEEPNREFLFLIEKG